MSRTVRSAWFPRLSLAMLGLAAPVDASEAQDKVDYFVECEGGLLQAADVIGSKHDYRFKGECTLWRMVQPEDTDEMQAWPRSLASRLLSTDPSRGANHDHTVDRPRRVRGGTRPDALAMRWR
jgi:hypothetical protein